MDNQGENNAPRAQDWEMLSLSMSMSSTSDPKPAPVDLAAEPKEEELGVWDAPMNSKYFVTPFDKEPSTEKPQEPFHKPEEQIEGQAPKDVSLKDGALCTTDLNALESKVAMKEAEGEAAFVSPSEPFDREFQATGIEEEENFGHVNTPEKDDGDKKVVVDITLKKNDKLAWWKRQSSLIFSQLKEANTILSLAVAAAVVGLAIIGHRWHHERLQNQQLRLQVYSKEEKVNQLAYQLGKMKESLLGRRSVPVIRPGSAYVGQF